MGNSMQRTLMNSNQVQHYGIKVPDNPVLNEPMYIMTDGSNFNLELKINGTNIFLKIHAPTDIKLREYPKVTLS